MTSGNTLLGARGQDLGSCLSPAPTGCGTLGKSSVDGGHFLLCHWTKVVARVISGTGRTLIIEKWGKE